MSKKRRSYTREFKSEAVRLVTEEGYTLAEAARSFVSQSLYVSSARIVGKGASKPTGVR